MKKRFLALLLIFGLTFSFGCTKKTSDNVPPATDDTAPAVSEENNAKIEAAVFTYEEVLNVFHYTEEMLIHDYGEPLSKSSLKEGGMEVVKLEYEDMTVKLADFGDGVPSLYEADLTSDAIAAPRGIVVGDALDNVLAHFPQDSEEVVPNGEENLHMLYGEYTYMTDYAYVAYDQADQTPQKIFLTSEGVCLEIKLTDDSVSGYHYFMVLN